MVEIHDLYWLIKMYPGPLLRKFLEIYFLLEVSVVFQVCSIVLLPEFVAKYSNCCYDESKVYKRFFIKIVV